MKIGDKQPVTIAGQVVAQAEVKELGDGTVTFIVPATKVVMATRVELTEAPREEQTTETIITGVDRPSDSVVETPVVQSVPNQAGTEDVQTNEQGQAVEEVVSSEVPASTEQQDTTGPKIPTKVESFDSSLVDA